MDGLTYLIFRWILVTFVLSAIIGVFFAIAAFFYRKTMEQSFLLFKSSMCGGLLGGLLLGSIVGCIIGFVVAIFTPAQPSIIVFSGLEPVVAFMETFRVSWIICTILGAIYGGLKYLHENW